MFIPVSAMLYLDKPPAVGDALEIKARSGTSYFDFGLVIELGKYMKVLHDGRMCEYNYTVVAFNNVVHKVKKASLF